MESPTLAVMGLTWFGAVLMVCASADGLGLGGPILLPFVARSEAQRQMVSLLQGMAPSWSHYGALLAAVTLFIAWPWPERAGGEPVRLAVAALAGALVVRHLAWTVRSRLRRHWGRARWDSVAATSGVLVAVLFGVACGSMIHSLTGGVGSAADGPLSPFALICGAISVAMVVMHGGTTLSVRCPGPIAERAGLAATLGALAVIMLSSLATIWLAYGIDGFLARGIGSQAVLADAVVADAGTGPWPVAGLFAGLGGALLVITAVWTGRPGLSVAASSSALVGLVAAAAASPVSALWPAFVDETLAPIARSERLAEHLALLAGATLMLAAIIHVSAPGVLRLLNTMHRR